MSPEQIKALLSKNADWLRAEPPADETEIAALIERYPEYELEQLVSFLRVSNGLVEHMRVKDRYIEYNNLIYSASDIVQQDIEFSKAHLPFGQVGGDGLAYVLQPRSDKVLRYDPGMDEYDERYEDFDALMNLLLSASGGCG